MWFKLKDFSTRLSNKFMTNENVNRIFRNQQIRTFWKSKEVPVKNGKQYFVLFTHKGNHNYLKLAIFVGFPLLIHSAKVSMDVAKSYTEEKTLNPKVDSFSSKLYTSWVGQFVPFATVFGAFLLVIVSYKVITTAPCKVLLSADHKTVAIITNRMFGKQKINRYSAKDVTLSENFKIIAPNLNTPGKTIKYPLHRDGKITSKPLFNSVFGLNRS